MELFGFIDKKNYCYLFYVLGVISFLSGILSFLALIYILISKQYFSLWSMALQATLLFAVSFFQNYILYSMCKKLINK